MNFRKIISAVFQLVYILSIATILSCNGGKDAGHAEKVMTNIESSNELVEPINKDLSNEDSLDTSVSSKSSINNELIPKSIELKYNPNPSSRLNIVEFNKIENVARKDAEVRYPDHNIRGSIRGDSTFLLTVDSKRTYSQEYFLRYDYKAGYIDEIDLKTINPYKEFVDYNEVESTTHQMLGNNLLVNDTKEKIKRSIPKALYDLTPNDYLISAVNPFVVSDVSPDITKILLRYSFHLLPNQEILEHQTYPGINTYLILDVNTGEEINRVVDLPFIPYSESLTIGGKYLIVTHTQDMKGSDYSTKGDHWKHQASIYNTITGELCFRSEGKNECNCIHRTINGLTEIFISGFQCYDKYGSQDLINNYFIKDNSLIKRNASLKEGIVSRHSTIDYEAIETIDGKVLKYYYNRDYKTIQELCK